MHEELKQTVTELLTQRNVKVALIVMDRELPTPSQQEVNAFDGVIADYKLEYSSPLGWYAFPVN